ncbi:PEPTIDASE S8 [Salix koriyanagi]|uniref:PEPTIDASE S8 n=1 Tax=Salix koriyanagi TaxID=2511006 RepID=A0A9Q0U5N1_9ROSI|nr:PEPTIDASE S8 [Salix koriyanagi]
MKMAMDPIPYQQQELTKFAIPLADGDECFDADILAAFDAAISDGVDVLSVSLEEIPPHSSMIVSQLALSMPKHGIVVICSAGNSGPADGTVSNVAPWEITVGASTMDREFPSYVVLGNNISFKGRVYQLNPLPENKLFPLL